MITEPYIEFYVSAPLARDYDEGEILIVFEKDKEFHMRLVEGAFKGECKVKAVPLNKIGPRQH